MIKKVLKGVQLTNVSAVPALYFFRPKVQAAVRAEVWNDLRSGKKLKVPAGCQGIYGQPSKFQALKLRLKGLVRK